MPGVGVAARRGVAGAVPGVAGAVPTMLHTVKAANAANAVRIQCRGVKNQEASAVGLRQRVGSGKATPSLQIENLLIADVGSTPAELLARTSNV